MPTNVRTIDPTRLTRIGQTLNKSPGPTATDCERAGCLQHCPRPAFDPLLAALIGAATGGIVIGGVAYFIGKKKGRR